MKNYKELLEGDDIWTRKAKEKQMPTNVTITPGFEAELAKIYTTVGNNNEETPALIAEIKKQIFKKFKGKVLAIPKLTDAIRKISLKLGQTQGVYDMNKVMAAFSEYMEKQ